MDMINVKINGRDYSVPAESTVLEACRYAGIDIPTLCYLKDINQIGACRLCLVEVVGARGLVTACVYPANEGMEILTNTAKVQAARKTNIELVLSAHEKNVFHVSAARIASFRSLQMISVRMPTISRARLPKRQ